MTAFNFEPVEALARRLRPEIETETELACVLGVHRSSINRYRRAGANAYAIDEMCTALGAHPTELYPDWASSHRVIGEHLARRRPRRKAA